MCKRADVHVYFANGSIGGNAEADLVGRIRPAIDSFLGQFTTDPKKFGKIRFRVITMTRAISAETLMKTSPGFSRTITTNGVPVTVWMEGSMGAKGFLYCDQRLAELKRMIEQGPPERDRTIHQKEGELKKKKKAISSLENEREEAEQLILRLQEKIKALGVRIEEENIETHELEQEISTLRGIEISTEV